jgi:hypothetical protein
LSRLSAIGAPIWPSPTNPIFMSETPFNAG